MRICILVPDGVGVRNYLYSDIISEILKKNHEVVILHSLSTNAINEVEKIHNSSLKKVKLPKYKETIKQKFLRELICYNRLKFNVKKVKNDSIITNWNPNKNGFNSVFYYVLEFISLFFLNSYKIILKLEDIYQKSLLVSTKKYEILLKKINVDVVFSTHQRSIQAIPVIKAAQKLNIKTVGAIFSWDNLPKARLNIRTDSYVVWSDYMKNEMSIYYPEIKQEYISVTGTPQFEFYKKRNILISKEDFFKKYKLDINKKTICFSGDDELTSPFDHLYLEDISKQIISSNSDDYQILFRRCPVDVSNRYNNVIKKYSNLIKEVEPLWNFDKDNNNWSLIYPSYEDVRLLVNTVFHSDLVINIGSTMAHDFSIFNKPSIYIKYDLIKTDKWSTDTIYKFQHFNTIGKLNAVYWLNSTNNVIKIIDRASVFNESIARDSIKWLDIIANHRENSSINIVNYLLE